MKNWLKILFSMIFLFGIAICLLLFFILTFEWSLYWVFIAILIFDFLLSIVVFFSRRRSEVKLSWILFINFIPFIGFCSFIFFGRKYYLPKQRNYYAKKLNHREFLIQKKVNNDALKQITSGKTDKFSKTFTLINNIGYKPIYINNSVHFLASGPETFVQLFKDIENAEEYVFMTFYIVKNGELFEALTNLIQKKIKQGVRFYLIYDHVGSYFSLSRKNLNKLNRIGVRVVKFLPLLVPFLNGRANYRNHRKDIVIDGKIGYTGGINLGDTYINQSSKFGLFHDIQIRIEGPAVRNLEIIFLDDWYFSTKYREDLLKTDLSILEEKTFDNIGDSLVQVYTDSPNSIRSLSMEVYISLISAAKKKIWLSTPYFIPPQELINALITAAKSGVDVRLIIPGLTDKVFILDITKTYCKDLFDAGVKIYESNEYFTHSKIAIFDDEITLIGTCNLDYRSLFADHQTNVIVNDPVFIKKFAKYWEWNFEHSTLWRDYPLQYKPLNYRILLHALRILSPIL